MIDIRTFGRTPKIIVSDHCLEAIGPKRRHRKKRLQKKFIKLYGMNYKSTAYHDKINNVIFMHPEYKKALDDAMKKQAEDSKQYAQQMCLLSLGLDEAQP